MKYSLISIFKKRNYYISRKFISYKLISINTNTKNYKNILIKENYFMTKLHYKKSIDSQSIKIIDKLSTTFIGHNIYHSEKIDSTNLKAKELAKNNCIDGTLVIANEQYSGVGRFKRKWVSPKGGLWFSIILKPTINPQQAPKLTLIAAYSLFKALNKLNLNINIKWPNDLLINNKKFCGILTEMTYGRNNINYIILGIGINSNISLDKIPFDLQSKVTSLMYELNQEIDNLSILYSFLNIFENQYLKFIQTLDIKDVISTIKANSNIIGTNLIINTPENSFNAQCLDIDNEGNLVLKNSKGDIFIQNSGEISFSKLK